MKVKLDKKQIARADGKSTLNKAVKNVKEILETKNAKIKRIESRKKKIIRKIITRKKKNLPQCQRRRGIVYVGHIPHGFYEDQIKEYFKQFGHVTRVRLSRSKESGKSRGYGYVEFNDPDVAKIAAETMNNYLMFGRLVKAAYIPPEKQHNGFFSKAHWTKEHYPRRVNRAREVKVLNAPETKEEHKIFVKKSIKRLSKLGKKLKEQGIDLRIKIGREIV